MKTIVIIPTYNEKENIGQLLDEIMNLPKDIEALVVDDDSPDGTWRIVEDYSKKDPRVHLLRRTLERGRGLAEVAGFKYALEKGADYILTMDADFSHQPQYIPQFLQKIKDFDIVIGSRFLPEGGEVGRGFLRRLITRLASTYLRALLGFKVTDPTSGYRCFRERVLGGIDINTLRAKDPFILTEVLHRSCKKNFRIGEIPILFQDRKAGTSKLGGKILLTYLLKVLRLRIRRE